MIKRILMLLVILSSLGFTQSLSIVFDANCTIAQQNDSTRFKQFLFIATKLAFSLRHDNITITEQRINENPLSIKERFNLLDSLYSDLYLSISCDVKNDSKLQSVAEIMKRVNKFNRTKPRRSRLDSLFQSEYYRFSGKSIPDSAEIFYPITRMYKTNRLTHMVLDLKPILDTFTGDHENEKLANDVVTALHSCIMQYAGYLQ